MNRIADDYSFPSVSVDNERGVRMAVGHLVGLGHRRIAHIAGPQDLSTGLQPLPGLRRPPWPPAACRSTPSLVVFAKAFSSRRACGAAASCWRAEPGCTAVAAGNDMLARRLLRGARRGRAELPGGHVGGRLQRHAVHRPAAAAADHGRFPHYQVGTEAAQLLLERIAEHSGPVKILYLAPEFDRPRLHRPGPGLTRRGRLSERLSTGRLSRLPAGGPSSRRCTGRCR